MVNSTHTADDFWFDSKQGFCEHIASAFAVLMRGMGVPARIVTGYQGGERNSVDNYWTVRNSDAHAWTEIWIADQGWVRIDPTGAVSPGRVGQFQRLSAPAGAFASAVGNFMSSTLQQLRAYGRPSTTAGTSGSSTTHKAASSICCKAWALNHPAGPICCACWASV